MSLLETVTVRRGNVLLTVSGDQAQRYLDQGYDIVDASGTRIIEKSTPKDTLTLMKAYTENTAEIKRLKEEIERLQDLLKKKEEQPKTKTSSKKN